MTHREDEIRRRLSVLENKLKISNNSTRGESFIIEAKRRIRYIQNAIESLPKKPKTEDAEAEIIILLKKLAEFEKTLGIIRNNNPDAPLPREDGNLKYEVNFTKSRKGNAIRTGDKLLIKVRGAKSVSSGIYKNGSLIMLNQSHKNDEDKNTETVAFLLKRRRATRLGLRINLTPGTYVLKSWFVIRETNEQGTYTDEFEIYP